MQVQKRRIHRTLHLFSRGEVGKGNVEADYSQGESITGRVQGSDTYPAADQKSAPPDMARGQPTEKRKILLRRPKRRHADKDCCCCRQRKSAVQGIAQLRTTLPTFVGPGLESFMIDHGVEISSAKPIEEGGRPLAPFLYSGFGTALLFIGAFTFGLFPTGAKQGGAHWGAGIFGTWQKHGAALTTRRWVLKVHLR
jgi:hypothetical protein